MNISSFKPKLAHDIKQIMDVFTLYRVGIMEVSSPVPPSSLLIYLQVLRWMFIWCVPMNSYQWQYPDIMYLILVVVCCTLDIVLCTSMSLHLDLLRGCWLVWWFLKDRISFAIFDPQSSKWACILCYWYTHILFFVIGKWAALSFMFYAWTTWLIML